MVKPIKKPTPIKSKSMAAVNTDGWMNVMTGLGTHRDKNTYSEIAWQKTMHETADGLFSADEIGAKVAKIIPYDGTREGITWNMDQSEDQEEVMKFLDAEFIRLGVWEHLAWGWTLGRVFGGALVFLSLDDGLELEQPVIPNRIRKINSMAVFDRWELQISATDIITNISDPNWGRPEFYTYNNAENMGGEFVKIHHSRVLRFDGVLLPNRLYKRNGYWHDSIYGTLQQSIRNYSTTHDSIALLLQEFNQPVFHIEGLSEAISQDEDELVIKKIELVNLMRSIARAVVLDKEDEFTNVSTNVAGGSELVDLTVQRLVAGSDIPHTRLLGNSPTGLGATGLSELTNYYDSVRAQQNLVLRKPIQFIADMLFQQRENKIKKPKDLSFKFNPLFQQDQEKEIRTKQMQSSIDKVYMESGVYDSIEVAKSRFGTGRYSFETVLDQEEGPREPRRQPSSAIAEPDPDSDIGALADEPDEVE